MKLSAVVITIKGLCVLTIGVGTPLGVSLAQYANLNEWPSKIVWWGVVVPSCIVGGANALLAWLSNAFKDYTDDNPPKPDPPA